MMETSFNSVVFYAAIIKEKRSKDRFSYLTTHRLSWGLIPSGV